MAVSVDITRGLNLALGRQRRPLVSDFEIDAKKPTNTPLILRIIAFGIFFFPSSMVLRALGAVGTVPVLLSTLVFLLWAASTLSGLHDPIRFRHPGRFALGLLMVASSLSYVALMSGWTGGSTPAVRLSADRGLIFLTACAGIILVTAERIRTLTDALVLIRALLAGGVFCCLVALIQFYFRINPMEWIQAAMPGFSYNGGDTPFQPRGGLVRVAGSTFHSIELAVVTAMLLPLSVWRSLYDPIGRKWVHWGGTSLLVFALASTVSRSGVLGLTVGSLTFLPFLPPVARKWSAIVIPVVLSTLFITVPGLISTVAASVTADNTDPSIKNRTDNYPRVMALLEKHPVLGVGPSNYVPENATFILDNQYLSSAVTLGLVGLIAMIVFLLLPGVATLQAARVARTEPLRCLAGAIAAAGLVAGVCSLGFDSMSFPVFALVYPVFVGLGGAIWILVKRELVELGPRSSSNHSRTNPHPSTSTHSGGN